MADKPNLASGYRSEQVSLARATCLYLATKLGDLVNELVIVGGLVPSLLIDPATLPVDREAHVGTMDLDVGLAVAILDEGRYRTLSEALRRAGLTRDVNEQGNPTHQRWRVEGAPSVTVDFLIPPTRSEDLGGRIRNLEQDCRISRS